jgi:hypothetical protein
VASPLPQTWLTTISELGRRLPVEQWVGQMPVDLEALDGDEALAGARHDRVEGCTSLLEASGIGASSPTGFGSSDEASDPSPASRRAHARDTTN